MKNKPLSLRRKYEQDERIEELKDKAEEIDVFSHVKLTFVLGIVLTFFCFFYGNIIIAMSLFCGFMIFALLGILIKIFALKSIGFIVKRYHKKSLEMYLKFSNNKRIQQVIQQITQKFIEQIKSNRPNYTNEVTESICIKVYRNMIISLDCKNVFEIIKNLDIDAERLQELSTVIERETMANVIAEAVRENILIETARDNIKKSPLIVVLYEQTEYSEEISATITYKSVNQTKDDCVPW